MYFLHNLSINKKEKYLEKDSKNGTSEFLYYTWLDSLSNGIAILSKDERKLLFINQRIKKDTVLIEFIEQYQLCRHKIQCQNKEICDCKVCIVNKLVDKILENKQPQYLDSFIFKNKYSISLKIMEVGEFFILEVLKIDKKELKNQILLTYFNKTTDMIFYKNQNLEYCFVNNEYLKFFKLNTEDEIIGKTDKELMDNDLFEHCYWSDLKTIENGFYYSYEENNGKNYQVRKEFIHSGVLGIIKDITNEKQLEEIIKVDALTRVYSRNYFNDIVKKIYEEKKEVYLILIDLDDLRKINNTFGHVRGDKYLKKLGETLKEFSNIQFFRIGGDEFAGITDISKSQLEIILKMIFEKINTLNLIPKLSISIGVGKIDLKNSFLTNYSEVDKILYKVKENGKNNFEFRGELE